MALTEAREHEYYHEKLGELGYVPLQAQITAADTAALFSQFRDLLHVAHEESGPLGAHIIQALHSEVPGRQFDGASFIERRRIGEVNRFEPDPRPGTENKDTLHYTPYGDRHARAYFRDHGGIPKVVEDVLDGCAELHAEVARAVRPVLGALGLEAYIIAASGSNIANVHLVRLLRYPPQSEVRGTGPTERAELHLDRSTFTAAIAEDAPGLVGASGNNAIGRPDLTVEEFDAMCAQALGQPIDHHAGEIKFFPGAGYNHLPERLQAVSRHLQPLLHGVMSPEGDGIVPQTDRFAAVLFMNPHSFNRGVTIAAKEETGATLIREALAERQERHGAPVPL